GEPHWLRKRPGLVGAAGAVPDLQPRTVGGTDPGRIQTPPGVGVDQAVVRTDRPRLGTGTVAVPQLQLGAIGRNRRGQVPALAQRLERVALVCPLRGVGAVAGPQLDRGAVGGVRAGHVHTLAAEAVDRAGRAATTTASAASAGSLVVDGDVVDVQLTTRD